MRIAETRMKIILQPGKDVKLEYDYQESDIEKELKTALEQRDDSLRYPRALETALVPGAPIERDAESGIVTYERWLPDDLWPPSKENDIAAHDFFNYLNDPSRFFEMIHFDDDDSRTSLEIRKGKLYSLQDMPMPEILADIVNQYFGVNIKPKEFRAFSAGDKKIQENERVYEKKNFFDLNVIEKAEFIKDVAGREKVPYHLVAGVLDFEPDGSANVRSSLLVSGTPAKDFLNVLRRYQVRPKTAGLIDMFVEHYCSETSGAYVHC
ncbi:hypothetical protein KY366_08020 [Candidatus Woesearchaeota archaeon]|nr:hypothetical protein [Candidatus Woesearchaeota archaeon]